MIQDKNIPDWLARLVQTLSQALMAACGRQVFKTARHNGFASDARKATYGRRHSQALVLIGAGDFGGQFFSGSRLIYEMTH